MTQRIITRPALAPTGLARRLGVLCLVGALAACGGDTFKLAPASDAQRAAAGEETGSTVWDLFSNRQDPNQTIAVNKYLWRASLEVLDFLPVESIDPFSGVIVTGYGRPPGGGRAYRATIHVTDPALDARSLKLSLEGAGGAPVAADTVRAVEDAILTRARQIRVAEGRY